MRIKLTRLEKKRLESICTQYGVYYKSILKTLESDLTGVYFGGNMAGHKGYPTGIIEKIVASMAMED